MQGVNPAEGGALGSHHPLMKIAAVEIDIFESLQIQIQCARAVCAVDDEQDSAFSSFLGDLSRWEEPARLGHHVAAD